MVRQVIVTHARAQPLSTARALSGARLKKRRRDDAKRASTPHAYKKDISAIF